MTVARMWRSAGVVAVAAALLVTAAPQVAEAKAPKPNIGGMSTHFGSMRGGTKITIRGSHFSNVTSVKFGKRKARSYRVRSASRLVVVAPRHAHGRVNIRITTSAGTSKIRAADHFTFITRPTVRSVTGSGPSTGKNTVTVYGTDFVNVTAVSFGTARGTGIHVSKPGTLRVIAPAHVVGTVNIRVRTRLGLSPVTSRDRYSYNFAPVTRLTATPATNSIALRWSNPASPNLGGVVIRRAAGSAPPVTAGSGTAVASLSASSTSYTDSGLSAGVKYSYSVFAHDTSSPAHYSARATVGRQTLRTNGVPPVLARYAGIPTADALPTAHINSANGGVVWSQTLVGNTVYAAGHFSSAGEPRTTTNPYARHNLLGYSLTTGALTTFAPNLNAQALVVTRSPDGKRIYVGGDFTKADGATHNRIAAYSTSTHKLITTFKAGTNSRIRSIVATNSAVYVGGVFTTANGVARSRLAAFTASTGALTSWKPAANGAVYAMALTPHGTQMIVGGAFSQINSHNVYGLGAVTSGYGYYASWAANQVVRAYDPAAQNAAFDAVTTDGNAIYASAFNDGNKGNSPKFEGTVSADPDTGTINWIEDCHGDSYGLYATGGTTYVLSHAHNCATVGGFPDETPAIHQHAMAFSSSAVGKLSSSGGGYGNFAGQLAPSIADWFPDFTTSSAALPDQAAFSITGNGTYLAIGGQFPTVNGTANYGLIRFAIPGHVTQAQGPRAYTGSTPSASGTAVGGVTVTIPADWDRDTQTLTYQLYKSTTSATTGFHAVGSAQTAASEFWNLPTLTFTDNTATVGATNYYLVKATDPQSGKAVNSASSSALAT